MRQPTGNLPQILSDAQGHFHGPMAHAFACGAQMAVTNEAPWNIIARSCSCCSAKDKRKMLEKSWSITDAASWNTQMEALLEGVNSDEYASLILHMRTQAVRQRGAPVDPGTWRGLIKGWCTQNDVGDAGYQELLSIAKRVLRYEERFATDGLLPPGGFVPAIVAYDFGRGVNLARWGVHAEYVDAATAEPRIIRAGAQSMRYYTSWAELSAGYTLGRCLRFDDDEFGEFYTEPLAAHHALLSDPQSPWLNIPFRM